MKKCEDIGVLKKKMYRFERLMWYTAGIMTLKFGGEAMPVVMAALG